MKLKSMKRNAGKEDEREKREKEIEENSEMQVRAYEGGERERRKKNRRGVVEGKSEGRKI